MRWHCVFNVPPVLARRVVLPPVPCNLLLPPIRHSLRTRAFPPHNPAADIKVAASAFGASLVGITRYDARWHYKAKFTRHKVPPARLLQRRRRRWWWVRVVI